jgi:hypothetical protein
VASSGKSPLVTNLGFSFTSIEMKSG